MKRVIIFVLAFFTINICQSQAVIPVASANITQQIITGAERTEVYIPLIKGKRLAIFANQTSMVGHTHLVDTLIKLGLDIKTIFGPEHGFRGTADAGEKVGNYKDEKTGIPVISLYGSKRKPSADDLKDIDIMIFDIQDVGVRFYTFISSLQEYIECAIENNKPLIILDRPNPTGFYIDGPVLDLKYKSFVGMQPVPIVYGMTIGEYAKMILFERWIKKEAGDKLAANDTVATHALLHNPAVKFPYQISAGWFSDDNHYKTEFPTNEFHVRVIGCENYSHKSRYVLPVRPSPNLPNIQSIYLYPSTCFFEGTVLSEGRGTDKPFQVFGHPSLPKKLYSFIPNPNEGAKKSKLYGQVCYGWDLSGSPEQVAERTGNKIQLKWLIESYKLFPQKDSFFIIPKSGRMEESFFNKLAGNNELWQQIKSGKPEKDIRKSWEPALAAFKKTRKKYLLYADFE